LIATSPTRTPPLPADPSVAAARAVVSAADGNGAAGPPLARAGSGFGISRRRRIRRRRRKRR